MTNLIKFAFISDIHIPYEDKESVRGVLNFIYKLKPEYLILGGDLMDFYELSRFDKSPERRGTLQLEIDRCRAYLQEMRKNLPKTKMIFIEGNHENRLKRWLVSNPDVHSLRSLSVSSLLGLEELDIEYMDEFIYKNFLFKHGNFITRYTANKELVHEGMSGLSGHTHKMQVAYQTDRISTKGWWVNGHLCDPNQAHYGPKRKDWQQGFTLVSFEPKGDHFHVEHIFVNTDSHKFCYGGKIYGPKQK